MIFEKRTYNNNIIIKLNLYIFIIRCDFYDLDDDLKIMFML